MAYLTEYHAVNPHGHSCTKQLIDYLCSRMRLRRGLMCPDLYCRIFSATITTYNYFIQPNLTLSNYEAQIPHPFMLPFVLCMYQRKQGARICYPHLIWWHESLCRQHSGVGHHWNRFCNWLQFSIFNTVDYALFSSIWQCKPRNIISNRRTIRQ